MECSCFSNLQYVLAVDFRNRPCSFGGRHAGCGDDCARNRPLFEANDALNHRAAAKLRPGHCGNCQNNDETDDDEYSAEFNENFWYGRFSGNECRATSKHVAIVSRPVGASELNVVKDCKTRLCMSHLRAGPNAG